MKKHLLSLLLVIATASMTWSQTYYSYTAEGKVTYIPTEEYVLVGFKPGTNPLSKLRVLNRTGLHSRLASTKSDITVHSHQLVKLQPGSTQVDIRNLLESLQLDSLVTYTGRLLLDRDNTLMGITNQFIVKLKKGQSMFSLVSQAIKYKLTLKPSSFDSQTYLLTVSKNSNRNALELANLFHESNLFDYAEPDFLRVMQKHTSDPLYAYQWALENTASAIQYSGTSDADLDANEIWSTIAGCNSVIVAIIDEGVNLTHPDLTANLVSGYDATGNGSNGAPSGNDAHGTNCAGIVAASANNGIGIAGIAYNSKVMPVRIAYSSGSNWVTSNSQIAAGINWAVNNGADILSNSWGGGSSSTTVNNAIDNAVNNGRGGLGSVVLFSAGNYNSSVSWPATRTNVIAVGASSMCDTRKRSSSNPALVNSGVTPDPDGVSCDNESWWGSNYGTGLDVLAPGVKIYSTDIAGSAGYSTGDYFATFNGTSSACPYAAGVMALILSANSNLTATQARQILEANTDKVGGYYYTGGVSGQPNGTWCANAGYGRINAKKAIQAIATGSINYGNVCASGSTAFSVTGAPSGVTYAWSTTDPSRLTLVTGSTSATAYFTATNPSANGYAVIDLKLSRGGCSYTLNRNIWIGVPDTPTVIWGPSTPAYNSNQTYMVNFPPNGFSSYDWEVPEPAICDDPPPGATLGDCVQWGMPYGESSNYLSVKVGAVDGYVKFRGLNACGPGPWSTLYVSVPPASITSEFCPCGYIVEDEGGRVAGMVYPNPANTELTIDFGKLDSPTGKSASTLYFVQLTDDYSNLYYSRSTANSKIIIPIGTVPRGMYNLTIKDTNGVKVHRIQIIH